MPKKPKKTVVLKFEMRNWEQGYWLTFEVPYTKHNWDWVVAHPKTANIRKIYKDDSSETTTANRTTGLIAAYANIEKAFKQHKSTRKA